MTSNFVIVAATYIVAGMIPALIAVYLFKVRFIGGIWAAILVGVVASFSGGLIRSFFLGDIPDIIPIAGVVDAGPPLILSIVLTVLYGLVSQSNS